MQLSFSVGEFITLLGAVLAVAAGYFSTKAQIATLNAKIDALDPRVARLENGAHGPHNPHQHQHARKGY